MFAGSFCVISKPDNLTQLIERHSLRADNPLLQSTTQQTDDNISQPINQHDWTRPYLLQVPSHKTQSKPSSDLHSASSHPLSTRWFTYPFVALRDAPFVDICVFDPGPLHDSGVSHVPLKNLTPRPPSSDRNTNFHF